MPSEETEHKGALITIKRINGGTVEIWRVEGSETDEDLVDFTVLFSLVIQQDIAEIKVFDDFALVIFEDNYILIANRPDQETTAVADYAFGDTTIGDDATDFLYYGATPINKFAMTPLPKINLYMLTMQYTNSNGTASVDQHTFTYNHEKKYGIFRPFGKQLQIALGSD